MFLLYVCLTEHTHIRTLFSTNNFKACFLLVVTLYMKVVVVIGELVMVFGQVTENEK